MTADQRAAVAALDRPAETIFIGDNMPCPYRTTYHRDGTVTYWDIHDQRWWRITARAITLMPRVMATLSATERARIERMAARG